MKFDQKSTEAYVLRQFIEDNLAQFIAHCHGIEMDGYSIFNSLCHEEKDHIFDDEGLSN